MESICVTVITLFCEKAITLFIIKLDGDTNRSETRLHKHKRPTNDSNDCNLSAIYILVAQPMPRGQGSVATFYYKF